MSKVMLVEDDNNLREIYEARLMAEGYDIVTAHDGEEALVVAKAEMPDLIISDVMMPKISGFEMLDILRNTDGLKDVKVIMLTALGQSDDQQRADRLGADSYLVKSQVTLEDIVKVAERLLGGEDEQAPVAEAAVETPAPASEAAAVTTSPPAESTPAEVVTAAPATAEPSPEPIVTAPEPVAVPAEPVAVEPTATVSAPEPVVPVVAETPPAEEPTAVSAEPVAAPAPEPTAVAEPSAPIESATPTPADPAAAPVIPGLTLPLDSGSASSTDSATTELPAPATAPLPDAMATSDESADVLAQIEEFAHENIPAPVEVDPVEQTTTETEPAEQFLTTAPPDLKSTAPPADPTVQSAGNDDVLANALESLTGVPPTSGETPAPMAGPADATAPAADPVVHGGGRVITPLVSPPKPDLNTLLSIEEAKEQAVGTTIAPIPGADGQPPVTPEASANQPAAQTPAPTSTPPSTPGATTTPTTPTNPQPGQSVDPNSIAL